MLYLSSRIALFLQSGTIKINPEEKVIELIEAGKILPYSQLVDTDWGYVYEKFVGQEFEARGYRVTYHSMEKGLLDGGVDLIAENDTELNFLQCKFQKQKITKSRIEWILYKASPTLHREYNRLGRKLTFTLVVNDIDQNFSKKKPKGMRLNFSDIKKVKYPWMQYFLDHNHIQNKVKLEVMEIRMER
jgi:predicted helicase